MSPRLPTLLGLLLLLPLFLSGCGKDDGRVEAELGSGDLRWTSFPVEIQADNSLYGSSDLQDAIDFWETKAGRSLFVVTGAWTSPFYPYEGDPGNPDLLLGNVLFFQAPWPFDHSIQGKTVVHSSDGRIEQAVIFLNGETTLCEGDCSGLSLVSRRKLIAHELGHFIGFGHSSDTQDIMFPEILSGGSLSGLKADPYMLEKLTN